MLTAHPPETAFPRSGELVEPSNSTTPLRENHFRFDIEQAENGIGVITHSTRFRTCDGSNRLSHADTTKRPSRKGRPVRAHEPYRAVPPG